MLVVPAFFVLFQYEEYGWAVGVFIAAAITDKIDGMLARKRGQTTTYGKLMDPAADKILTNVALLCLCMVHAVPVWIFAIFLARDALIDGLKSLVATESAKEESEAKVIAASKTAQLKTFIQMFAAAFLLFWLAIPSEPAWLSKTIWVLGYVQLYASLILCLWSAEEYLYGNRHYIKTK
jgi:CDP-diacylglycerol--glycerol-3-phosphate 3-phosphatidyltransferase